MNDIERILLECRYLLSLDKNYSDLAHIFNISVQEVESDLNDKLLKFDYLLYKRVHHVLKKNNCS